MICEGLAKIGVREVLAGQFDAGSLIEISVSAVRCYDLVEDFFGLLVGHFRLPLFDNAY
jgi:hypothetical protein